MGHTSNLIGSLREIMGTAYWLIRNLRHFGFTGPIYPVNPNSEYNEVFGSTVYSTINDVPKPVDLAVLITPPNITPGIIEQCAQKGVKAVVVLSEGFAESGEEGIDLQRQLTNIAHRTGIRIMGPNTFGVVNSANGLATIAPYLDQERIERGGIAICSQTGSTGPQKMPVGDWAYPISKMCDVDESDIMDYLADDAETKVVSMHLEDVRDRPRFMAAVRRLVARKPLVVLKTARSEAGAKASASHAGRAIAEFSERTVQNLAEVFPRLGGNPVDIGPAMSEFIQSFLLPRTSGGHCIG